MKQILSLILSALIVFSFAGCKKETKVDFYYPRTEIQYGISDGVIASESRELSGENLNLEYLLKLYLEGPVSQGLRNPFPAGTALLSVTLENKLLTLTLSESFGKLENMDYTIACACLATTGFALTDVDTITILSGSTSITLTPEIVSLVDNSGHNLSE